MIVTITSSSRIASGLPIFGDLGAQCRYVRCPTFSLLRIDELE